MGILLEENKFMRENLKLLCKITGQVRTIQTLGCLFCSHFIEKKPKNILDMEFPSIHECRENVNARQSSRQGTMQSPESPYRV